MFRISDKSIQLDSWSKEDSFIPVVGLIIFAFWLKAFPLISNPQFWAEDGGIFFKTAWEHGSMSIVESYAGYFVILVRLAALISTLLPLAWIPFGFVAFSLLLHVAPLYLIFSPRCNSIFPDRLHKTIFTLIFLLGPGATEMFGVITNIQWFFSVFAILLIVSDPPKLFRTQAIEYVLLFLICMTGPFVLILFPVYIFFLLYKKIRFDRIGCAVLALTFILQLVAVIGNPRPSADLDLARLIPNLAQKVMLMSLFGSRPHFLSYPIASWITISCFILWAFITVRILFIGNTFVWLLIVLGNLIFFAGLKRVASYNYTPDLINGARYAWLASIAYMYAYFVIASSTRIRAEKIIMGAVIGCGLLFALPSDLRISNPMMEDFKKNISGFKWLNTGDHYVVKTDPAGWYFLLEKKTPSPILNVSQTDSLRARITFRIENDTIKTSDGWALVDRHNTTGNQVFVVLKSSNHMYVFQTQSHRRPDVSTAFNGPYDDSGFSLERSIAYVNPGKYRFGLFIHNDQTNKNALRYLDSLTIQKSTNASNEYVFF